MPPRRKPLRSAEIDHTIEHRIVFLGNPNVGKSSLFNILTGSHQHIGNWPGKTVEKKEGHFILSDEYFSVIDLPGAYSLSAHSEEELVTRQYVVEEKPDLVCAIVDATRLERTLYIALQALELTDNIVLIVNMMDLAEKEGIQIERAKLEKHLGIPVLLVSAFDNNSIMRIKKFLYDSLHTEKYEFHPAFLVYSQKTEMMINSITRQIENRVELKDYPTRWIAIKVLEEDKSVISRLEKEYVLDDIFKKIDIVKKTENYDPSDEITKRKYEAIRNIVRKSTTGFEDFKEKKSDKIDKIVMHRVWGYFILVFIYAAFFLITFYASSPIISGLDYLLSSFSDLMRGWLYAANSPDFVTSLLVDGILSGISAVLLFIPIITIFYILVAIMEDSGYLARSAYTMDRVLGKFGLQGTAFLSMIMGLGCNVTGIMAARTIKSERDRLSMILTNSFIPCAARLGVIAFLTAIFFEPWFAALLMLALYGMSFLLVFLSAMFFKIFLGRSETMPMIIEIPEYRLPRLKNIFHLTWERTGMFVKKAGTFIFLASIVIWFVSNIPFGVAPELTIAGYIGRGLAYITEPLFGFDWRMVVPLLFGIPAKEAIISALGILYYSPSLTLIQTLRAAWSIPQTISFLVFQLTYAPCFATLASIRSETKSWKMTAVGFFYPLIVTSLITVAVYYTLLAIF
ncbi:MAG: ferrous iron transport protein B [Candidatus Heimdallarchaeota archaeon]|nr:ferrous iron transport protein B [Candidatus Heimdallarchaeota archaeon]